MHIYSVKKTIALQLYSSPSYAIIIRMTVVFKDRTMSIDNALETLIYRLDKLSNLLDSINEKNPVKESKLALITVTTKDIHAAFIDVLIAVGLSAETIEQLGIDTLAKTQKISATEFVQKLDNLIKSQISEDQREILLHGAAATKELLASSSTLKNAKTCTMSSKDYHYAVLGAFVTDVILLCTPFAGVGYMINGATGAKFGLGLCMALCIPNLSCGELAQAKYNIHSTVKALRSDIHEYRYSIPNKEMYQPVFTTP